MVYLQDEEGGFEWNCGDCNKPHVAATVEFTNDLHGTFREAVMRKMLGGKGEVIFGEELNLDQQGLRFRAEDGAILSFNMGFFVAALKQGPPEITLKVTKRWLVNGDSNAK